MYQFSVCLVFDSEESTTAYVDARRRNLEYGLNTQRDVCPQTKLTNLALKTPTLREDEFQW